MKSLEQHNEEKRKFYKRNEYPKLNGIACPECGNELYDVDQERLLSSPPKRKIYCEICDYKGTRIC